VIRKGDLRDHHRCIVERFVAEICQYLTLSSHKTLVEGLTLQVVFDQPQDTSDAHPSWQQHSRLRPSF